jgi:hypothetical protein
MPVIKSRYADIQRQAGSRNGGQDIVITIWGIETLLGKTSVYILLLCERSVIAWFSLGIWKL